VADISEHNLVPSIPLCVFTILNFLFLVLCTQVKIYVVSECVHTGQAEKFA
jgi:hypothetical protein